MRNDHLLEHVPIYSTSIQLSIALPGIVKWWARVIFEQSQPWKVGIFREMVLDMI